MLWTDNYFIDPPEEDNCTPAHRSADPSLYSVLAERYDLDEEVLVEGRFVQLFGSGMEAVNLAAVAVTTKSLIIARVVLDSDFVDYELYSMTPLILLRLAVQNYSEKIINVWSQQKGLQVYQLCTCPEQDVLWDSWVAMIEQLQFYPIDNQIYDDEDNNEEVVSRHSELDQTLSSVCSVSSLGSTAMNSWSGSLSPASDGIDYAAEALAEPPTYRATNAIRSNTSYITDTSTRRLVLPRISKVTGKPSFSPVPDDNCCNSVFAEISLEETRGRADGRRHRSSSKGKPASSRSKRSQQYLERTSTGHMPRRDKLQRSAKGSSGDVRKSKRHSVETRQPVKTRQPVNKNMSNRKEESSDKEFSDMSAELTEENANMVPGNQTNVVKRWWEYLCCCLKNK